MLSTSPSTFLLTLLLLLPATTPWGAWGQRLGGRCHKEQRTVTFRAPGYMTAVLHTNECRETVTSSITPLVSLNPGELLLFRRHYSTCCCAIANTSLHQSPLRSLDGRPELTVRYRRIEECVCVDCADLSTHRRVQLEGQ